jgi:tyrosine-protein kinase Etk/Wzc
MEAEKGDSHSSSEEIISEDSSEEPIVIRTIDRPGDTSSEKSIGGSGKDNNTDSNNRPNLSNSNPMRHQSPEMTVSPRYEPTSLRHNTDLYSNQLSTLHYPNNNALSLPPPIHPVVPPPGHISLNEILGVLRASKWFIFRILLLMALLALFHIWITQPVYRADALLAVEERAHGTGAVADRSNELSEEETVVGEEVEILKSRNVHGAVVDKLKLDLIARPKYFPLIGIAIARKSPVVLENQVDSINESSAYTGNNEGLFPYFSNKLQSVKMTFYRWLESTEYAWGNEHIAIEILDVPDSAIGEIFTLVAGEEGHYKLLNREAAELGNGSVGEQLQIQLPGGNFVLLVSDLISAPGKHFELQRRSRTKAVSVLQDKVIVREKAGVVRSGLLGVTLEGTDKIKIAAIVNEVMDTYIRQNIGRKATNAQARLTFMEEQLAVLEESMNKAEQALNDYRQQQGSINFAIESEVLLNKIVNVETEISRLTRSKLELTQRFKPEHASVIALDSQTDILRSELDKLNGQVKKLPGTERQVLRMTRDVDVQTTLYSFLYNKIQELRVNTAGQVSNLRVVDYAVIPYEAVKPQPKVLVVAYILLGLIVGIGSSFFRRALKAEIHDPEFIETQLGLNVHATIPLSQKQNKLMKGGFGKITKNRILAAIDPDDPAIRGLRGLRTSLYFAQAESRNNLILITGPAPGVGKSFVSINYATVLVSAGKRVLVIDADFRKGAINEYVGMDRHEGLADLITGNISAEEVIRNTDIKGLDIIQTGRLLPNPSELLLHENFAVQLQNVSRYYDYVIIDAPPVLALSDAAVIGRLAGLTLLVVKSGMHTQRQLQHTIKQLQHADVRLEGVVFNGLDTTNTAYGHGQNYSYAHY